MKITYYGNFAFAVSSKNGVFVLNPSENDPALLFSLHTEVNRDLTQNGKVVTWPGEYEFGGTGIITFELPNKKLGAKVLTEGLRMLFLPASSQEFSEHDLEVFGDVDILVLETADQADSLKKLIEEIDPKVVIPVGSTQEKFLGMMGGGNVQSSENFICSSSSLPVDQTQFVKLIAA
jgi:hypothetical protein